MSFKIRDIEIDTSTLIGESSKFQVYLGKMSDGQRVVVKVSKSFKNNKILTDDATEFSMLKNFELRIRDLEHATERSSKYYLLFANLLSSFIEESIDGRRINVFTIPEIDLDDLIPLAKLSSQVEIDARTSVWIIGRLLKFYSLFELLCEDEDETACRYPIFSEHDYLISPEKHRLVYYNFPGEVYDVYATEFVKAIANYILQWTTFDKEDESTKEYQEILEDFASIGRTTAAGAHRDLYQVVEKIWGISYYPFTYRQRRTINWNIKEN